MPDGRARGVSLVAEGALCDSSCSMLAGSRLRAAARELCAEIDRHYVWDIGVSGSAAHSALSGLAALLPP